MKLSDFGGPVRPWKPSQMQEDMLFALLDTEGEEGNSARKLGGITHQSSDGAAYTLRSLVSRGLVRPGAHDGDRYTGYQLTGPGRQFALDKRRARADRAEEVRRARAAR